MILKFPTILPLPSTKLLSLTEWLQTCTVGGLLNIKLDSQIRASIILGRRIAQKLILISQGRLFEGSVDLFVVAQSNRACTATGGNGDYGHFLVRFCAHKQTLGCNRYLKHAARMYFFAVSQLAFKVGTLHILSSVYPSS